MGKNVGHFLQAEIRGKCFRSLIGISEFRFSNAGTFPEAETHTMKISSPSVLALEFCLLLCAGFHLVLPSPSSKDSAGCSDWPTLLPVDCYAFDWRRIDCRVWKSGGIARDCRQEDQDGCNLVVQHRK